MRRLLLIAALVTLLTIPLCAQRRGGASVRGFSPSHGNHFVGVRPGSGVAVRGGFAFGHNPRVFVGTYPYHHHRRFIRPYPFYGYPYFYGYSYGYGYPPAYPYPYMAYPYYGVGLQSDLVYSTGAIPTAAYMDNHDTGLQNEVYRLQAQVDQLRQQQYAEQQERQQYALSTPSAAPQPLPATRPRTEPTAPPTVLVFRDGHREETRNYAVAGQTLWIFSEQRARKVPLSELNVEATRQANEERGIEFAIHTPAAQTH